MTEEQIIQEILAGEEANFRILIDRHQEMVFRTAMGFLHERTEAEDMAQEVFIRAYRSLHTFRGDSGFATWLYRITVNLCLNQVKRKRHGSLFQFWRDHSNSQPEPASSDPRADETMESEQYTTAIQCAIDALPEKQRTAFILSKYEELTQREIATVMECSEGAVEQYLQRAKKNLQKTLGWIVGN